MISNYSSSLLLRIGNKENISVLRLDRIVYYIPYENTICYLSDDEVLTQTPIHSLIDFKLLYMNNFYKLESNIFVNMNLVRSIKDSEFGFILKTKGNRMVNLR